MKKLYIALIIIVVLAIAVIVGLKYYHPTEAVKRYTDSTGTFSFEYPAYLSVAEQGGTVALYMGTSTAWKQLAVVAAAYQANFLPSVKDSLKASVMKVKIGSDVAYKIAVSGPYQSPLFGFVFPLDDADNPSEMMVVLKTGDEKSGLTEKQVEAMAKSLHFDKAKALALANSRLMTARVKGADARIEAEIAQLRAGAEVYFTDARGYTGLCTPKVGVANTQALRSLFADIASTTGAANIACYSQKASYAVSVKLPSGPIFCVDSSGFFGSTTAMIKGLSCK